MLQDEPESGPSRLGERSPAYVVVDDECRCLDASDSAFRLLAVAHDQLIGAALAELLSTDARERFGHVWRGFREGGGHAGPFRVDDARQVEIDIDVTAGILPSRHLVMLTDASRRNRPPAADGASMRHRTRRGQPAPSAREREILRMLAAGATDNQIASRLSLSPATVRTHVRNAKTKLGARTRTQAVAVALDGKLIDPP